MSEKNVWNWAHLGAAGDLSHLIWSGSSRAGKWEKCLLAPLPKLITFIFAKKMRLLTHRKITLHTDFFLKLTQMFLHFLIGSERKKVWICELHETRLTISTILSFRFKPGSLTVPGQPLGCLSPSQLSQSLRFDALNFCPTNILFKISQSSLSQRNKSRECLSRNVEFLTLNSLKNF